ncbi:MAG TPA: class I SAM-dependent methyltransferase [Candidatus Limnocylindria bacterium]|jgi:caffeoyl-CoA O-methyltransferase|nr:class I SAM-dependent methyltransferase [Candidatus Limnocylindria bacterium]
MPDITDPQVEAYATEHSSTEPPLLVELAAATRAFSENSQMMVGRLEGRFLKMLVALTGARRVLEVGTFTGYSALSMAEALPADGRLITCELDDRHAELARQFIDRSPYREMIEIRVGPALETIEGLEGPFDFVFIDADKQGYRAYYEAALSRLAPGGLIAADNVLWSGRILDDGAQDEQTRAVRDFNRHVAADPRVDCVVVPIRDGVSLIRLR